MARKNKNKNGMSTFNKDELSQLSFDPSKDKFLKQLNLKCELNEVVSSKDMFEVFNENKKRSDFILRTRTEVKYNKCKPLKKIIGKKKNQQEVTVDSDRVFTPSLTVVYDKEENLDFEDPSVSVEKRKLMVKTRINTIDKTIKSLGEKILQAQSQDEITPLKSKLEQIKKSKDEMNTRLNYLDKLEKENVRKRLFG